MWGPKRTVTLVPFETVQIGIYVPVCPTFNIKKVFILMKNYVVSLQRSQVEKVVEVEGMINYLKCGC